MIYPYLSDDVKGRDNMVVADEESSMNKCDSLVEFNIVSDAIIHYFSPVIVIRRVFICYIKTYS